MKKHNYCLLILFFCGWVFGRHIEIPDLQLSELNCNQYSQDQPIMVELENCAPVELDIGGYCLTDSEGLTYTFPDETKVSPGGLVVVVMGDPEEVDFPMNEEAIWLFCTENRGGMTFCRSVLGKSVRCFVRRLRCLIH
mgnify:CR=1 FL=1